MYLLRLRMGQSTKNIARSKPHRPTKFPDHDIVNDPTKTDLPIPQPSSRQRPLKSRKHQNCVSLNRDVRYAFFLYDGVYHVDLP